MRRTSPETGQSIGSESRDEVLHILVRGAAVGQITDEDRSELVHIVAARTGLTQPEAQSRVDAVSEQIKDSVDKARKSAAAFSLFGAFSLLIGAFIAAAAAALGGAQQDE